MTDKNGVTNAAHAWLEALEIYERAPGRVEMKDRSIIFPMFSGISVFLKGGKIQQDKECNFEQNLVRKFVRETKLHGEPTHYTRALAMQCEVQARLGKYRQALETFGILKSIYNPEEHSEGVSATYGTDRSAQAFSQSALWHAQLGELKQSYAVCEYVLTDLFVLMDPKNVLNSCELLLPIIRIYKPLGQAKRMRDLFDKHVVQNFHKHFDKDGFTPCLPLFKPLMMLLDICHDPVAFPNFEEAVEWLTEEENGVPPDFLDSIICKLCWSPYGMVAELCLRIATRLIKVNGNYLDAKRLVEKGLGLAKKAHRKLWKSGKVLLPIAYEIHKPVYDELVDVGHTMGIFTGEDDASVQSSKTGSDEADPTKNLPSSYLMGQHSNDSFNNTSATGQHSASNDSYSNASGTIGHSSVRFEMDSAFSSTQSAPSAADATTSDRSKNGGISRKMVVSELDSCVEDTSSIVEDTSAIVEDFGLSIRSELSMGLESLVEEVDEVAPESSRRPSKLSEC
jgi:hypothetical protein